MAISLISNFYEIASVVSLPRNDVTTSSHKREVIEEGGKISLGVVGEFYKTSWMREFAKRRWDGNF